MLHSELESSRLRKALRRVITEDNFSIDSEDHYYTCRGADSYNSLLPRYNGLSFLEVLRSKINTSDKPIAILDVGCGQGVALAELLREFPGKLRVTGISATDLREYAPERLQRFIKQIDMKIGDAHFLKEIFQEKKFDFIVSVKTFEHLEYPGFIAQQCRELLKPYGLAFIEGYKNGQILPQLHEIVAA